MTAPQDGPAGPVLGEEDRRKLAAALAMAQHQGQHVVGYFPAAMDAIEPVVATLVRAAEQRGAEAARREDGERLRHVDSWDEVSMLIQVWRAGVPPCGAVTRRLGFPQVCLREPGHMLPGHGDGTRGGAW